MSIKNYNNVYLNLQFIENSNWDTFIYQVIGGLVGSVVACIGREIGMA